MKVYVVASVEYDAGLGGHVVRPLVPVKIMSLKNAWSSQREVSTGLFELDLSPAAVALIENDTEVQTECAALGMVPKDKGQPKPAIKGLIAGAAIDRDPDPGDKNDWKKKP